jgi:hypothetical protein
MKVIKEFIQPETIVIVGTSYSKNYDLKLTDDETSIYVNSDVSTTCLESLGSLTIMSLGEFSENLRLENEIYSFKKRYIIIEDFVGRIGVESDNEDFDVNTLDPDDYIFWEDEDVYLKVEGRYYLEAVNHFPKKRVKTKNSGGV